MTEHNLLIWIQRTADYLRLIKDVIPKQSLPAVSTWIREWKREEEKQADRGMAWVQTWLSACEKRMPVYSKLHRSLITEEAKLSVHYHITKQEAGAHAWLNQSARKEAPPYKNWPAHESACDCAFIILHYHSLPFACGSSAELQEIWLSFVKAQASWQITNRQTNRIRVRFRCGRPQTGNTCR